MPQLLVTLLVGLIGLIGVLIGTCIGGVIVLLTTYLTHYWKKSERYQELLAEKRFSACAKIIGDLIKLDADLSPIENGVQPLREPAIIQRINELGRFAGTSEIALGAKVARVWYKHYRALSYIQFTVQGSSDMPIGTAMALQKLMNQWIDEMIQAIKEQLRDIDVEFISFSELKSLNQAGTKLADSLIDAEKARKKNKEQS